MPEQIEYLLPSGSIVYMTGVVDLKEIYIRKLEDHDDDHEQFLDMVNEFCASGKYKLNVLNLKLIKLIVNYLL